MNNNVNNNNQVFHFGNDKVTDRIKEEMRTCMSIDEVEYLRKNAVKNFFIWLLSLLAVTLVLGYIFEVFHIIMLIIPVGLAFVFTSGKKKEFDDAYKKYFALSSFNDMFSNVVFDLNNGISASEVENTHMMKMWDRFSSNDHVTGKFNDISFEYSDILIEDRETDDDGHTHYVTMFKGQWFIFDFNKYFKSNLQVCEKGFSNAKRNNSLFNNENNYKKIELEDIEFNKQFRVYAQNELEAFYVLTPNSMQRIKELNAKINGNFLFCFIDNKLHIALQNNKDSFERSIFGKIDEAKERLKVSSEVKVIKEFIEILNLDNTLFKRNISMKGENK